MKGKILGIILSIAFYSNIFSIQFTNNTNYVLIIATKKIKKQNLFNCICLQPYENSEIIPYEDNHCMLIGFYRNYDENLMDSNFSKDDLLTFEYPKENIQINENYNSFFVIEQVIGKEANIITKAEALKDFKRIKQNTNDKKTNKKNSAKTKNENKPKTKIRILRPRMFVIGGIIAASSYFLWHYNKKSQKTNTPK